jgi:serine/threonine protein kinase/Tfp pilus assembly protein PilF
MSTDKRKARELFLHAVGKLPPEQWEAYIAEACGVDSDLAQQVGGLLQVHREAGSFLDAPAPGLDVTLNQPPLERPGTQIGPYKLLQQIGEGGMGVVYMAEQAEPVQRKVALKVIKPGMDSRQVIARFEAERQALAMMDHVNIARVLDAGATENGRPYFVMELVHGVPITKYCDDNRLTPRQRLELFVPVCHAIQHAHQKGIIHRDIKPSNVMVTLYDGKPVPKVIDFGVAKATEQKLTERTLFTQYGTMVGTLEYMSPEQAEMSALGVDTRSDIFSLGVLLYELLTGSTPLSSKRMKEAAYAEILRLIKEEEPPKPSTRLSDSGEALASISAQRHTEPAKLSKLMRGELDWIVMKTLEKDRSRRYETAKDIAADVQRYLDDEAVLACPPSAGYRLRKFARRNKRPVLAALLVLGVLVAGIFGTTWGMLRATFAEAEAVREAAEKTVALRDKGAALATAKANEIQAKAAQKDAQENLKDALAAVDQMLTRVANDRLQYVPQMEPIRRDLLLDALKFYQKFLDKQSDDPVIRREAALAYQRVGRIHQQLGQYQDAERAYRSAFEMFDKLAASASAEPALLTEMVECHLEFSWPLGALGKSDEAAQNVRRAVELADKLDKKTPGNRPVLLNAREAWASTLVSQRPEEAEKILKENLELADDAFNLEAIHRGLACVFVVTGRLPQAEKSFRQALKFAEQMAGENPSANWVQAAIANDQRALASVTAKNQRAGEAEEILRRAVLILDKLATDFPNGPGYRGSLADALIEDAGLLKQLGQPVEEEKAYRRALELYGKLATDFPTLPTYQQTTFDQRLNLGQFLVEAGRAEDALDVYRQAIDLPGKLAADAPTKLAHWRGLVRTHIELGRLLLAAGKKQEAEAAFGQAVSIQEKLEKDFAAKPEHRRDLASSHSAAARLLRVAGRVQDAERVNHLALTHWQKLSAEVPDNLEYLQNLAESYGRLAKLLDSRGRVREAEEAFLRAIEIRAKHLVLAPADAYTRAMQAHSHREVGFVVWHTSIDRLPEAEKHYRAALQLFDALHAEFPDNTQYWDFLTETHRCLGRILGATHKPHEAETALRQAIELDEQRAAKLPDTPEFRWKWSLGYYSDLASQLVASGGTQEAKEVFRQAAARFSKTIELNGKTWWAWSNRGEAYAELGEWDKAEADFAKAVELAPEQAQLHYRCALARLALADTKRYHETCADMVVRFGHSPDLETAYWSAWTCALAPDAVTDWQPVVLLAEKSLAADPKNYDKLRHLGAVLYRAGRFEDATKRLIEADAAFKTAKIELSSISYIWLFQAMTEQRLGHTDEAKMWLHKAVTEIEQSTLERTNVANATWNRRLTLQFLRREAEELLGKKSQ